MRSPHHLNTSLQSRILPLSVLSVLLRFYRILLFVLLVPAYPRQHQMSLYILSVLHRILTSILHINQSFPFLLIQFPKHHMVYSPLRLCTILQICINLYHVPNREKHHPEFFCLLPLLLLRSLPDQNRHFYGMLFHILNSILLLM